MTRIISIITAMFIVAALSVSALAADKANGAALYKKNCAGCHGATGEGNGPAASSIKPRPANFVSNDYKDSTGKNPKDYSDAELTKIIEDGRKNTSMVAWKKTINPTQTADLVAYIRSLHK